MNHSEFVFIYNDTFRNSLLRYASKRVAPQAAGILHRNELKSHIKDVHNLPMYMK
jgi:hypothetical protein